MARKIALFVFNGEPMCFGHALLNALDMKDKGHDVRIIVEGSATRQLKELTDHVKPFAKAYARARRENLIDCVCHACASKMDVLNSVEDQGLPIDGSMAGHPPMSRLLALGYEIVVI